MSRRVLFSIVSFALLTIASSKKPIETNETRSSCEDITNEPKTSRCDFAQLYCSGEGGAGTLTIDYASWYYCHVEPNNGFIKFLFWGITCVMAIILFSQLSDTAEKYFSPTLTQICQQVPKMRPRFAGVTVLAFANGAPDLSATISAIQTCKFDLSLGALTGAGMFVNTFVAGWIILASGGAKCRGATIRDVVTYFITVFGVLIALFVHRIGIEAVVLAFILYVGFVVIVFGADEWHEKGRPDFWSKPFTKLVNTFRIAQSERALLPESTGPVWATYEDFDINTTSQDAIPYEPMYPTAEEVLERENLPIVWAQLSPDQYRQQALAEMAGSDDDLYDYPLDSLVDEPGEATQTEDLRPSPLLGSSVMPFETETIEEQQPMTGLFGKYPWLWPIWETFLMDDLPDADTPIYIKAFLLIRLPLLLLQRSTIPLTSREHYSRVWLIVSSTLSPLAFLVYFDATQWWSFLIAFFSGSALGTIVALGTTGSSKPPEWSFGTSWPIGSSVIALYGLLIGIFWINILADELVELLHFAGTVTGIPEAVLGLTVLAWGNSVGDFFTNTSIAKAGKGNMALTACYAGPVFNMLMGLGLGFISFFVTNHHTVASIYVGPQVILGCVFLLVHAAAVIIIGIRKGFRLPARFGYFSISVYGLYLIFAISLQFMIHETENRNANQCFEPSM